VGRQAAFSDQRRRWTLKKFHCMLYKRVGTQEIRRRAAEHGWEQPLEAVNGRVTPRNAAYNRFGSWCRISPDINRAVSHWGSSRYVLQFYKRRLQFLSPGYYVALYCIPAASTRPGTTRTTLQIWTNPRRQLRLLKSRMRRTPPHFLPWIRVTSPCNRRRRPKA
jgi:hypothetical protein